MLKQISIFGLCIVVIAGMSVPVRSQQQLAGNQAKAFTFDGNKPLAGWTITGDVTIDATKGRQGKGCSLKIGPGGKALLKLRDSDESGKVEVWVYDDVTTPEKSKARRVGPRWGLVQSDGKLLAVGILYASYLGGDEGYTATACDGRQWYDRLFWLGVRRVPAGWHKWTFDFDPELGLQVFHNDRQVNAVDSRKTGLKGFSAFAVWGDEDEGRKQTIWLADMSVTLGGPVFIPPTVESDPYEEKAVAAEMATRHAVTVYTEENAPATPKPEDLLLKQNVSQYGITWSFQKPARVGQFVNGDWYVVGPATIEAIDPKPLYGSEIPKRELDGMDRERKQEHRVRNGFMLNPPARMQVAYDSGVRNWFTPSLIQKLPVSMKPGDSLVSTISMPKNLVLHAQLRNKIERGVDDSSPIRTAAVLTCVEEPQPLDAFRPAFCDRKQKIYLARNLKRELLPTADATKSMPKIQKYIRFTQRPWVGTCFFGFEEPVENMPQYGLEYGRVVGISALLLCTGLESQQKEPLLVNLIQVGIDLGGMVGAGHPGWTAWGGHGSGRKLPIVFAGLLLGDDEAANVNRSFPKVSFGEDEQTAYRDCWTGAKVVFAGHSGIDAATGEGRSRGSGWGPYEHTPPSQWEDGQNTSESYRRCCTSIGWVAQALAMRLMHAEKAWSHDAFFDYVDRWMYEDDSAFVKTIKESTGRDHDKEWARQGQAWDAFVNEMWARHRPTLPAPTDGWKQKHNNTYERTAITEKSAAPLPPGVKAVWDLSKAYRETTPTRERIYINGLWRWQPAEGQAEHVPDGNWGYFKVPGSWPGITDYMQKDCQTIHVHPSWKDRNLRSITAAWYQRQITVPAEWAGRRITIRAEYLNSYATVYVDGRNVGAIIFPGGDLDITSACRPGATHVLSIFVESMPLKGVMLSYNDTNAARKVKGSVARRGLCGDVYLVGTPMGARFAEVKVDTSVRKWEVTFESVLLNLSADAQYALRAKVSENDRSVREFTSKSFKGSDLTNERIAFTEKWKPERLWDIHTPENTYQLNLSLLEAGGKVLDVSEPVRFGFREFWIDGRDFFLNGSRIFLSSVPLDNAQVGAAWANYGAARESMERLKSFGINFVYTHNYGCEPGTHLGFTEVLTAADDTGMLVSFSQPHFGQYEWESPDADETNGYARHAEFYVRAAQNHPSVVFYSMSHNATGYNEDMNPDMIDGIQNPRDTWSLRNSRRASRAAAIVSNLDPSRIVYHHSSGNLGPMHTSNFYANFVPIQEMSDWFEHWATVGVKPVFTCEYSVPFPWDWTMYRGWYEGKRSFGSARVPWEFCLAEWNSQFLGDEAFKISEMEKKNLRWEARQFRAGSLWHRWDYPYPVGSSGFAERQGVYAMYFTDNWRAFRTWGMSANSPWSHGHYWTLRDGVDKSREELQVDWENLQRPGFSPDYIEQRYERVDLAFEHSDWIPTVAAQALIRNNRSLLGYIAGKLGAFTSKDHNFLPGETVEKQLIVINNSRETITCNCIWSLDLPRKVTGKKEITVPTGEQERIPLRFELPAALNPGKYELSATFTFGNGQTQNDSFSIHVMTRPQAQKIDGKIALFDPKGQTEKLLKEMGIRYRPVNAKDDLSSYEILIVGKSALTMEERTPDIARVRNGLKVLMFEQTSDALEKRLGFRVAKYGLRWVFKRAPDHPLLIGIADEYLRDWRGEATILPPRLEYELSPRFNGAPTVSWCGMPVTRLWRCGNRGNVASVLIEKPARGDFLPILDGGYSLQYSPLMEYREGKGMVLFCQMDITGRTEDDPAAQTLARNILQYVSTWQPAPRREVVFVGDSAGRQHIESAGISLNSYEGANLSADQVLVVGPGGEQRLATEGATIAKWLKTGGNLLAVGLNEQQVNAFLPLKVSTKDAEHIAAYFGPFEFNSLLVGVGPADVHSREPRKLPLVSSGATIIGDGIMAKAENLNVVFCQIAPWQFDYKKLYNLKRTFRRTSYLLTRLLANMGAAGETPILERFGNPVDVSKAENRWSEGLYMDTPQEWDDPYRFFRW